MLRLTAARCARPALVNGRRLPLNRSRSPKRESKEVVESNISSVGSLQTANCKLRQGSSLKTFSEEGGLPPPTGVTGGMRSLQLTYPRGVNHWKTPIGNERNGGRPPSSLNAFKLEPKPQSESTIVNRKGVPPGKHSSVPNTARTTFRRGK